jgi:hypothetical protein
VASFMTDFSGDFGSDDDAPEATLVTSAPGFGGEGDAPAGRRDDDAAPAPREFALDNPTKPARPKSKAPPPAALAAKIHAPAVSELRKPRPSRRTPPGGVPIQQPNILQAIVSSQASEPMPAPRAAHAPSAPPAMQAPTMMQAPAQVQAPTMMQMQMPPQAMIPQGPYTPPEAYAVPFPVGTPGAQAPYNHDASGMPLGIPTPPGMSAQPAVPGVPDHLQPYLHMQGMPPGYTPHQGMAQMSPQGQGQGQSQGYPQMSPGALYQFQPAPQPMSLTGQLRLFEADELPAHYQLGAARRRWFTYIASGVLAVSVAAAVTFLIIRSTRESTPVLGSVRIESVPAGAEVTFDGTRLTNKTPFTIDSIPVATRHAIRVELARHQAYEETVDIPKTGGEVPLMALLKPITGKIIINSVPPGAEIRINGELRGRTPTTINDVDMDSAKRLELRLKDYQPFAQDLAWPRDGKIRINQSLVR